MKRVLLVWLAWGASAHADSESLRRERELAVNPSAALHSQLSLEHARSFDERTKASQRANLFNDSPRAGAMVSGAGINGRFDQSGRRIWLSDGRTGFVTGNFVQYSDGSTGFINGSFISVPRAAPPQPMVVAPLPAPPALAAQPTKICVTVDGSSCLQQQPVVYLPEPPVIYVPEAKKQ